MTHRTTNFLISETYARPQRTKYATSKPKLIHKDCTSSLKLFDINEHGPETKREERYKW